MKDDSWIGTVAFIGLMIWGGYSLLTKTPEKPAPVQSIAPEIKKPEYTISTNNSGQSIMIDGSTGDSWVWIPTPDKDVADWINSVLNNPNWTVAYKQVIIQSNTKPVISGGYWQKVVNPK